MHEVVVMGVPAAGQTRTFMLGGQLSIHRPRYGAMHVTGTDAIRVRASLERATPAGSLQCNWRNKWPWSPLRARVGQRRRSSVLAGGTHASGVDCEFLPSTYTSKLNANVSNIHGTQHSHVALIAPNTARARYE